KQEHLRVSRDLLGEVDGGFAAPPPSRGNPADLRAALEQSELPAPDGERLQLEVVAGTFDLENAGESAGLAGAGNHLVAPAHGERPLQKALAGQGVRFASDGHLGRLAEPGRVDLGNDLAVPADGVATGEDAERGGMEHGLFLFLAREVGAATRPPLPLSLV